MYPSTQAVHAFPEQAEQPSGQFVHSEDLTAEFFPAGQAWQVDSDVAPVAVEYVPAGQDVQAASDVKTVSAEYDPAGQS